MNRLMMLVVCILMLTLAHSAIGQYYNDTEYGGRDYLSRMFISPNGRILPSGVVSLAFGGAFASQGGREYLGLFSVGLGGVAEFEFSTTHLVTNIFNLSEPLGTTALKFTIYQGDPEKRLPTVTMALRSNRWSSISGSGSELAASVDDAGISEIEFKSHVTTLYMAGTSELSETITAHGGIIFSEIRTRDLSYTYDDGSSGTPPGDMRKNLVAVFAGIERRVNENTYSMFEFGGQPSIEFNDDLQKMSAESVWYGMMGVRFFVTEMAAIDAGLRYRSDFTGLADTEIRAGLNLGFDIGKEIRGKIRGR